MQVERYKDNQKSSSNTGAPVLSGFKGSVEKNNTTGASNNNNTSILTLINMRKINHAK